MKKTTTVIPLLLCLFFNTAVFAQRENTTKGVTFVTGTKLQYRDYPDSVRIEFPDHKAIVIFQMKHVNRDLNFSDGFPEMLQGWLKSIASGSTDLNVPQRTEITRGASETDVLTMHANTDKPTRIVTDKSGVIELVPAGWEIFYTSGAKKIYVYAPTYKDLESLSRQNFQPANETVRQHVTDHPLLRKSLIARLVDQENKVSYSSMKRRPAMDFLDLSAGAGFGFLHDKFYPELNLKAVIRFGDHFNRINYNFTLSYDNMFFSEKKPDGGYQSNVNSFLSISFNKNLQSGGKSPVFDGFGGGYLIHREGDYFHGRTIKLFINKKVGPVTISPELYLTNGVKDFSMGIKATYTF